MGQSIGRAPLLPVTRHYVNIPYRSMHLLWDAFNDIAEGFGLTEDEMVEMLRVVLKDILGYTEKKLDAISKSLFATLDDDCNQLVDALEFLSSLAVISGMSLEQKVTFIFAIYDFDESGQLTVDETILALRSTMSGLCKLSGVDIPSETEIERIAVNAFAGAKTIDGATISREAFVLYCASSPEVISWLEFYSDIPEEESTDNFDMSLDKWAQKNVVAQATVPRRGQSHAAAMEDCLSDKKPQLKAPPPWMTAVAFLEPSSPVEEPANSGAPPDESLVLEWAFGFNSTRRQNVWYTPRGEIAYPAGSLCVVYDAENKKQRFLNAHTDVVECLRVFHAPSDTYAASGQLGLRPKIVVWSANTMEVLATIQGVHSFGVMHVDFSKGDGELLLSVGAPECQMIAVHAWRSQQLLFSAKTELLILDARFLDNERFATCGLKGHVHFWDRVQAGVPGGILARYVMERGLLCKKAPTKQPILCVCSTGEFVVAGAASGHLLVFEGRSCVAAHKAHASAITALEAVLGSKKPNMSVKKSKKKMEEENEGIGLATASTDGKVILWTRGLQVAMSFDVGSLGGLSPVVHSLCWDARRHKILVATATAEIFEISSKDGRALQEAPLVVGHSERRLTALATHPEDPNCVVTVGDDKVVYVWDLAEKKCVRHCTVDTMVRCCAFSPDGRSLALGMGGVDSVGKRQRKDGTYVVLDFETLTLVHEARDSKQPITAIAFSSDGQTLALGSEDRGLYLYNVGDYASTAKCRGHKGKITQFDWSEDSKFLQSTDDLGALLFWEVESGVQRAPRLMRDVAWETHRCVFGYSLQGAVEDGSFFTCCARQPAAKPRLLASMDNFGRTRLWRYPALTKKSVPSAVCGGHGSPGGSCSFTSDGKRLITTSRGDGLVLQWVLGPNAEAPLAPENARHLLVEGDLLPLLVEDEKLGLEFAREANLELCSRMDQTAVFKMEELGRDEDYQPLRPWQRTIVAPSRPPEVEDLSVPGNKLELDYVHGYRCHDVRGLAKYASTGEVIFGAARLFVKLDTKDRTQKFYREHLGEVSSLCISNDLVASSEIAEYPSVFVWDALTMETKAVFRGHHRRAVLHLCFSSGEQRYLVSVGSDELHTAIVFDWRLGTVVCKCATRRERPLALLFNRLGLGFVTSGANFVEYREFTGRQIVSSKARLGPKGKLQPFLCMAWLGSALAVGTLEGSVYKFLGRQLDSIKPKCHAGAINAMQATTEGLITGGRDGMVKLWLNAAMDSTRWECDLTNLGAIGDLAVRSLDWNIDLGKVLVGTLGAELLELDAQTGDNSRASKVLQSGHFAEVVCAAHPTLPQYCTVGDDAFLRVWSVFEKKMVRSSKLEMASRACCYSPDGKFLAVGFGGGGKNSTKTKTFDGKFVVMDVDDFSVVFEARDSQKYITEIKYSEDGNSLAVGSFDNRIYVYSNEDNQLRLQNMISQHPASIRSFDFSSGGKVLYLQSNCAGYELCFFEADTGMYIPAASRLRDVRWASLTCSYSWATQGVHEAQSDGTTISTCDVTLEAAKPLIATGDNFGRVRLWNYPCTNAAAKCKDYKAHTGEISRVKWVSQGSHLVTTSARDRIIMQWKHVVDDQAQQEAEEQPKSKQQTKEEPEEHVAIAAALDEESVKEGEEEESAAKEALSRPWLLAAVAPSNAPPADVSPPDVGVELAWVHGLEQERFARGSLCYTSQGDIVSPASKLAVIYSKASHAQRFYSGHDHALSALCVSADGRFVASGERARRPEIHVWNASSVTLLTKLPPHHRKAVASVAFSPDGRQLLSVGADSDGSICVWRSISKEWHDAYLVCSAQGDSSPVRFAVFKEQGSSSFDVCSGGEKHVYFWQIEGVDLIPTEALWNGKAPKDEPMLCGAAVLDRFVTGSKLGHLCVWKDRTCERSIRAHDLAIETIHACSCEKGEQFFATGSRDGLVKVWSGGFNQMGSFDLQDATVPPLLASVRSVHVGVAPTKNGGIEVTKVLVGTLSAELYELSTESGSWTLLNEAHHSGELWVVAAHPSDPTLFATAGDDGTVRIWSVELRCLIRKTHLDGPIRALCWSPDGSQLLIGMGGSSDGRRHKKDGVFCLLDAASLTVVHEGRDSRHYIRCVKFSPDARTFAIASMDQKIYLYDAKTTCLRAKCDKHTSYVTQMDFSDDSQYLQSDSADYEHLFFNVADGSHIRLPSELKDCHFDGWSCVYGWPVQGCWPSFAGSREEEERDPRIDITTTYRSHDAKVAVSGDENGVVRLHRYPCRQNAQPLNCGHSHVSSVAKSAFTCDDAHVITVGKSDRTIVVWKMSKTDDAPQTQTSSSLLIMPADE